MKKIYLSEPCKKIFQYIAKNEYAQKYDIKHNADLAWLKEEGLIIVKFGTYGISNVYLSDYGLAYYRFNPTLDNPTLWDDKRYIITTIISIFSLLLSVFTCLFSILR